MAAAGQLRLLLWKDYLIRKRKLVTLLGVVWATAVVGSLYIVRTNVDNQDFSTCQYPARALPSAGMLTFLQSFMCSVNNECSPMDQFDEIPTYESSKLTHLQRKLSPILNDTVLDVASSVPDAIKLIATLADVVDVPTFIDISKNGLNVKDIFSKPTRVKRLVSSKLELDDEVVQSVLDSQLSFQGIIKGNINRCSTDSISKTLLMKNAEHLNIFVKKLCSTSEEDLQKLMIDLLFEVDYSKYMTMLGEMFYKLTGDNRITTLGDMLTAVLRMTRLNSFLPPEVVSIFQGQNVDFSYMQLSLIPKLIDQFEPTYGDTQSYKSLRGLIDTIVVGIQYLDKIVSKQRTSDTVGDATGLIVNNVADKLGSKGLLSMSEILHNAADVFQEAMQNESSLDTFNIFAQLTSFVYKFLPDNTKHEVLLYSTLLSKLLESAQTVIDKNMAIEELTYNVTLRHPKAIQVLVGLPPVIIGKAFDALTNAERTQILTSKINLPSQMLCDVYKLQAFFVISKQEAESLKKQLCTDTWKSYVLDLIGSFGVYDAKNNINHMTSLLIQETLGKDTTDQLYSIDKDFQVLKNFTKALIKLETEAKPKVNWSRMLNISEESEFMKVIRQKGHLGKQMLIVVHGAIAKEVVQQNPILDFKLAPYLVDVTMLVTAMNQQLSLTSEHVTKSLTIMYPDIVGTVLLTAMQEEKVYKSLSTAGQDMLCNGVEHASLYLEMPEDVGKEELVSALCNATVAIEDGLKGDSYVSKAIRSIMNSSHSGFTVDWTKLINNLKELYVKLERDYPYLFEFNHYGMDRGTQESLKGMFAEAKEYWFGLRSMAKSLHLSVKLLLKFLDFLDYGLFDVSSDVWPKIKFTLHSSLGPFSVVDETVNLVAALLMNRNYSSDLPPTTVDALRRIVPNIPQLTVDAVNIMVHDATDIVPIIELMNAEPPWPCSNTSLSELLVLSETSKDAVRGLETIFCLDKDLQQEWVEYLSIKNATITNTTTWNTTEYEPHIFLKFSELFDSLVQDIEVTREALQYVTNDTSTGDHVGLSAAWKYAVDALNTTERNVILRKVLNKIDLVLNAINTSSIPSTVPVNSLWEQFFQCSGQFIDDDCKSLGRTAWKYSLESMSVMLENIASDLLTYFSEVNEPNSNILQVLGFTRGTGLFTLYDRMSEFMVVLLNSYWDFGFMSQVRRATLSQFWDCEAVVSALIPPPGSALDEATIRKAQPFICPSLLHWLSLPRGENTLLDVFAKPQYFFYTLQVRNLTSNYENAFTKATELADYLTEISKKNRTLLTEEDIKTNSIEGKLRNFVDTVLNYRINDTDTSYKLVNEINKKQFTANIYLIRIVAMINKLNEALNDLKIDNEDSKKLNEDIVVIRNIFKRRPLDAVKLHFDVLTDAVWNNNENYTTVNAFETICNDLNTNVSKVLLVTEDRTKKQICAKQYEVIYGAVQNMIVDDYEEARKSLVNLVKVLQDGDEGDVDDIFVFLKKRKQLINSLQASVKSVYDISLPVYLKYLQSNLASYNVVLSFLAGENWWKVLREVYNGPHANRFFGYVESSFEVAEDLLSNFDEIHLVRLLHDIDVNQTDAFCQPNITLSDYMPDSTGMLSDLKRQMCSVDKTELYRELPPMLFASQGYEHSLAISKIVNYTSVNADISRFESRMDLIKDGPQSPQRPPWVTEEKLVHFRDVTLRLLSKETVTKFTFAILGNGVDAGTLFLNNSQCNLCSQFTTWFKQLNLQLFKKQEYDNLLCQLRTMTLEDVHHTLKNDFHWDMMIKELISTRNYTKYEMNKSINEFLGQVKLYLLEDITAKSTKLTECLARNVSRNEFGNATLLASVLAHTAKLLRAELPHIHEVAGIKDIRYLKELATEVAHNLDVERPLKEYLMKENDLKKQLMKIVDDNDIVDDIGQSHVNLHKIRSTTHSLDQYISLTKTNWSMICKKYNCSDVAAVINNIVNKTQIEITLPKLQTEEFWRFSFISSIIRNIEGVLSHGARLLGVASRVDAAGVMDGRLDAMIDTLILLVTDDTVDSVLFSIQGIVDELRPLLQGTALEHDMEALSSGLTILHQMKNDLVENVDLKLEVSKLFPDADGLESNLSALGINNTNFWSIAAPRIHAGYIQLKPIFSSKPEDGHISIYVCQMGSMSKVLLPSNLDVVSADDVYAAVVDQFCGLTDERAKQILPTLFRSFNFTIIVDKVASVLLTKLYATSNLTEDEGSTVLSKYQQMVALIPLVQDNVDDVSKMLANEPLFQSLKGFSSVPNLLSSSDFLSSAGQMFCGKPFGLKMNKLYRTIAAAQDFSTEPDQAQLDVLPTDFCRSLYKDILHVEGGKILWSFVKPLIMGKILYTPPTPAVTRIIEKANSSFSTMVKMTNLVHSFAKSFPAVGKLSSHREGVGVLRRLMTSPQFKDIRAMITGDVGGDDGVEMANFDLDGILNEFGDLDDLGSLLTKGSDLLHCINLDRFVPTPDELQMTHEAARLSIVNEFTAGLVFLNNSGESLTNVEYKIRMDIENAPTTKRLTDFLWIPGPEDDFIQNMRYFRGFIQIQDLVDKAIIQLSHDSPGRTKRQAVRELNWAVYTQQTPYPCYRKDFFQTSLYESQVLLVAFFFSLLFTVASIVRFIVSDKETGNTMLMSVMGVDIRWHTMSWFISSLVEITVTCACVTLVLRVGHILPNTDPSLVFALLFIFGVAVLSFCYMISKLFNSASLAAVCAAIMYLVSFMPFVIILSLEAVLVSSLKLFVCLSMSSSLCYTFLFITRYEARGAGAGWPQLWEAPGDSEDMSIGLAAFMMIVDAALYLLVGWLVDRYFGIKTLESNITHCTTTDEKAGVSIVNVTKIYGERSRRPKLALDNVSIELHKGQVTTLLGHNGAGKTTLIKILTGMLKPTKGHVIVRSECTAGTRLGVCPQRDVLLEYMTAMEHIMLYAQLKTGLTASEVQGEVDKMLEVLSLGPVCSEPVARLSGGTRRRLCVALAFIGKPHLVSLDEPTAGVDPAARRDIWSMIVKLKEDRTILLTTHHLDEAELLSDQIVIMHKGQIHTTGSPIEIKRTLGNGYKLTVMYPDKDVDPEDQVPESWPEDASLEEKTKQLLALVRDVVKNANMVDINGSEVEIALPFYDANGLNNNFLQLCSVLEATQSALGFRSYTLDCSSLEQVFFNICQQADAPHNGIEYVTEESPSKSASSSSIRTDRTAHELLPAEGPLRGTVLQQLLALMHARYLHHVRNTQAKYVAISLIIKHSLYVDYCHRWLLFMLIILPAMFIIVAMGFSMLRPPADNEISLKLNEDLYGGSTEFLVPRPSKYGDPMDPSFAEQVMEYLRMDKQARNWTNRDSPTCECVVTHQECDIKENQTSSLPQMMVLPDVNTLNNWLIDTQDLYIEKRYGGFTSAMRNNLTNLVAWYNNKGHHAMPAYLNALNSAILRVAAGTAHANITTYTHPMKISKEQISKNTVYQHVADAGISGLVLVAYSLISAGGAIYLVAARRSQEKRLQLLSGVSPALYWATALLWDLLVMAVNVCITSCVMLAFGFPVFVARNNLPAICIMFMLYGFACSSLVHVAEKLFTEASIANMVLFCGNAFLGLSCLAILLILEVISESEATDNARYVLHKIFLLAPQFALGDGLLEIARNTIQAQVLNRFGMDTYKDPLSSTLVLYHYIYLLAVGTALFLFNLAIEYDCFEVILARFRSERIPPEASGELEPLEVSEEKRRVRAARVQHEPLRVNTIGNINRGFVLTEGKKDSIQRIVAPTSDAAQCVELSKVYPALIGQRLALRNLTLGIPPGQCTALLGENGAGKSTTFSMLTGEVRPTTGQIYLNNKLVNSRQLCTGLISYCPQSDAIDPLLTVKETLVFYCRLRGISDQNEVIKRTIAMFDLSKYEEVRAGTLSGGNKRKLCTAIAFMARTPLVLLDEPTSGMDPVSRACVSRGVRAARAARRGVLLSTHALGDARRLAARVALLRRGRLVALAPLEDCLNRFGGGYVVQCRAGRAAARGTWLRVRTLAPHAALRVLHHRTLHFLLPTSTNVDNKEVTTRLSDVFRLMADLQGTCDIEDYTVHQSSLEQMFLSFTDKDMEVDTVDLEPLPSPETIARHDELESVTSL